MNGGGRDLLSLLAGANHHYTLGLGLSETAGSLFLLGMGSLSLSSAHTGCFEFEDECIAVDSLIMC
jgi:hypothetical protein